MAMFHDDEDQNTLSTGPDAYADDFGERVDDTAASSSDLDAAEDVDQPAFYERVEDGQVPDETVGTAGSATPDEAPYTASETPRRPLTDDDMSSLDSDDDTL